MAVEAPCCPEWLAAMQCQRRPHHKGWHRTRNRLTGARIKWRY